LMLQSYKCSAVAEMGDRLATIDMGRKERTAVPLSGAAGSPSNTMSPGPMTTSIPSGIFIHPTAWPPQTWAENWGCCAPLGEGLGPHLTHCRLYRSLLPYTKWHLNPCSHLATIDMGRKLGGHSQFWGGEAGSSSNTMWPGTRPTSVPSFMLIHQTVWPQYTNVTDRQTDRTTVR